MAEIVADLAAKMTDVDGQVLADGTGLVQQQQIEPAGSFERLATLVESSVGVVTALTPYLGYGAAATLAHTALTTNASISELVLESGLMSGEELARVLTPERLSGLVPVTAAITLPQLPPMPLEKGS